MYPLGGLGKTAAWCRAVADGRFTMNARGDGFTVMADSSHPEGSRSGH